MKTVLLPGLALALFAAAVLWLGARLDRGGEATTPAGANGAHQPRYTLSGVDWIRTNAQGHVRLHATADQAEYFADDSATLNNIAVDELGGSQGAWRLTAPLGEVPAGEPRILLGKPATLDGHLANGEPLQLVSDHLWVDNARERVWTDDPVQMQSGAQHVEAVGLSASWADNSVQLLHDVKVHYANAPKS